MYKSKWIKLYLTYGLSNFAMVIRDQCIVVVIRDFSTPNLCHTRKIKNGFTMERFGFTISAFVQLVPKCTFTKEVANTIKTFLK